LRKEYNININDNVAAGMPEEENSLRVPDIKSQLKIFILLSKEEI